MKLIITLLAPLQRTRRERSRKKTTTSSQTAKKGESQRESYDDDGDRGIDVSNTNKMLSSMRGKMLGALETVNDEGETVVLAAFAGKLGGKWVHSGWVPPLAIPDVVPEFVMAASDVANMTTTIEQTEQQQGQGVQRQQQRAAVKQNNNDAGIKNEEEVDVSQLRRNRSERATAGIRAPQMAQVVSNFRGQTVSLPEAHVVPEKSVGVRKRRRKRKREKRRQQQMQEKQPKIDVINNKERRERRCV